MLSRSCPSRNLDNCSTVSDYDLVTNTTDPRHPIGVVAERTGLSPDVLRVWERRYAVVEPQRSPGGQRLYSDADIARLALLNRATRGGHGIGHVARLSNEALEKMTGAKAAAAISRPVSGESAHPAVVEGLELVHQVDGGELERLLRRNVARYGLAGFIDGIAAPFLRAVGDAWHRGSITISQEHMASAVVERIVAETAPLLSGGSSGATIVITTLEGERHGAGALMAAATAAGEGWKVIYLGADLPTAEIADMADRTSARAVGISIVASERKARVAAELRELESALGNRTALLVGGSGSRDIRDFGEWNRAIFVDSMSDLISELEILGKTGIPLA
jgi:DNA-binding transcriptional MerR regulator/methylmalonyl-CoA mutase cobalamin-binding subunit